MMTLTQGFGPHGLQAEAEPDECLITLLIGPPETSVNTEFNVVQVSMSSRL